jgi:hypothetical protein
MAANSDQFTNAKVIDLAQKMRDLRYKYKLEANGETLTAIKVKPFWIFPFLP